MTMLSKEDMVVELCDFQDDIIRDYRTRFSDALINRKYFSRSLEITAKAHGISESDEFRELKQDFDELGRNISLLRSDVIRKERTMRAISRTLPGEELLGVCDAALSDGKENAEYDAVVITPYAAVALTYIKENVSIDRDGFCHPAGRHKTKDDLAYTIGRKEALLKRKLRKYKDLPVYSMLLVTEKNAAVRDRYGKILITSPADVLASIRSMSDGMRRISAEEMDAIKTMLAPSGQEKLVPMPVDLKKLKDEYSWFVAKCSLKTDESLIGKIMRVIKGKPAEKPGTGIA